MIGCIKANILFVLSILTSMKSLKDDDLARSVKNMQENTGDILQRYSTNLRNSSNNKILKEKWPAVSKDIQYSIIV